jgi:hypothetical protein
VRLLGGTDQRRADVRVQVRERHAAAARATHADETGAGGAVNLTDEHGREVFGGSLYRQQDAGRHARAVLAASLGCGVPTAVADLREGQTLMTSLWPAGFTMRHFGGSGPPGGGSGAPIDGRVE